MGIRKFFTAVAVVVALGGPPVSWAGDLDRSVEFHIPAQPLPQAILEFSRQSDLQVISNSAILPNIRTIPLSGKMPLKSALQTLLRGTDFSFTSMGGNTVAIQTVAGAAGVPTMPSSTDHSEEAGKNSSQDFRVAQMGQGETSGTGSVEPQQTPASGVVLQEVIVSAQKRDERLQDVPVPVSVISAASLSENNQTRLRDYYTSVPGFAVTPAPITGNQQMLTIRGISSGAFGNPTVGVTIDDVPYGAFTRELAPDIDPGDLARVEVLRGPQGTLYGASSMGGLLKFVTVDPSTDRLFGRLEGGFDSVHNGAQAGYSFRGAVNVPVSDSVAVRASAFTRLDPGYIDNPVLGIDGVNKAKVAGGRLSSLWHISDTVSLKLSAQYQDAKADGLSDVDRVAGLSDLQQNYVPGVGPSETRIQAYSAILSAKLGRAELTSISGYNVYDLSSSNDYSYALGATANRLFGVSGASVENYDDTKKFSQEIRLTVPFGDRFEWMLGGFYTNERIDYSQNVPALNATTGEDAGILEYIDIPIKHSEAALFTDLTTHITDRFDIQLGGRQSHLVENFQQVTEGGPVITGSVNTGSKLVPAIDRSANIFTYLVTPKFRLSPHLMVYSRIASGYRPSRANSFNPDPAVPRTANPDKTQNYEIGLKGDFWDRKLTVDSSVYYIDWKDIQIKLLDQSNRLAYDTNGSGAKSEGVELSLEVRPVRGFAIAAWATYDDAVLTKSFPVGTGAYGPVGSRLPFSSRVSGNLAVDENVLLTDNITGYAGVSVSYVGDRVGIFTPTPARQVYPAYTRLDLRAGVRFESLTINLYANNVTDRRGVLGGGIGSTPPYAFIYLQPRTLGLSVAKSF